MQKVIDYKSWHIVIARNYGNTTINVYSDQPPVQHFMAETVESAKQQIDRLVNS